MGFFAVAWRSALNMPPPTGEGECAPLYIGPPEQRLGAFTDPSKVAVLEVLPDGYWA